MIGGHAAVHLCAQGHDVVLAARKPAPPRTPMAQFPVLIGDYGEGGFTEADLSPFEAIVFAAGPENKGVAFGKDPSTSSGRAALQSSLA